MSAAADKLLAIGASGTAYAIPHSELLETQVAAVNERLQERIDRIKIVGFRAREAGVTEVRSLEDVVPLLLPHTAYKSYPESFLTGVKWDKLTRWLATVSSYSLDGVDLAGVTDVDDWVARLAQAGHFVSCSSGTTGKSAMLVGSRKDMEWTGQEAVRAYSWGAGVEPAQDRIIFGLSAVPAVPRNHFTRDALYAAFNKPGVEAFRYPVPPMTVGAITRMIVLRKAIAEGTALPQDIAEFERTSAERQKAVDEAVEISANALIEARTEKLYVSGYWSGMYKVAEAVRERGFGASDFHPDNTMYVGGGLKGAHLPANYREYVYETFNISPDRNFQMYGMQELGSSMPRCREGGRYHVPPWLVCLPLNQDGDELLPLGTRGEIEGRAAFFDISLDGRWGGVISGDRIHVDFGPCACGNASPSIGDNIVRYSDIQGDDKIGCAGTVDAYVRGIT